MPSPIPPAILILARCGIGWWHVLPCLALLLAAHRLPDHRGEAPDQAPRVRLGYKVPAGDEGDEGAGCCMVFGVGIAGIELLLRDLSEHAVWVIPGLGNVSRGSKTTPPADATTARRESSHGKRESWGFFDEKLTYSAVALRSQ